MRVPLELERRFTSVLEFNRLNSLEIPKEISGETKKSPTIDEHLSDFQRGNVAAARNLYSHVDTRVKDVFLEFLRASLYPTAGKWRTEEWRSFCIAIRYIKRHSFDLEFFALYEERFQEVCKYWPEELDAVAAFRPDYCGFPNKLAQAAKGSSRGLAERVLRDINGDRREVSR